MIPTLTPLSTLGAFLVPLLSSHADACSPDSGVEDACYLSEPSGAGGEGRVPRTSTPSKDEVK